MESISWNENSNFLRDQYLREKMNNLWSREPANSQHKYTLFAPAAPVVLAHARIAAGAIQLKWKPPAKMEFSFQPTAEMEFSFQPEAEMKIG